MNTPSILAVEPDEKYFGGLEEASRIFGDQWNKSDFIPVSSLIGAGLVILAVLMPLILYKVYQRYHLRSKPLLTFHQLASHVGVKMRDQWLLVRIARGSELPSPLTLLLSRTTMHRHARQYTRTLPIRRRLAVLRRIAAMRQLLYH